MRFACSTAFIYRALEQGSVPDNILLIGLDHGAKERNILPREGQIGFHKLVQHVKLARIGFNQTNRRDRTGDRLLALLFALALVLLVLSGFLGLLTHARVHSAAKQPALVPL